MRQTYILSIFIGLGLSFGNLSCQKYLDAKSDQQLALISRISDLQGLLDDYNQVSLHDPAISEAAAENYYVTDESYQELPDNMKNLYVWAGSNVIYTDHYGDLSNPWYHCYINIYSANVILSNIDNVIKTPENETDWNSVKGQAYFLRAHNFMMATSLWCLAYDQNSASTDLGIPLRLDPDINKPSKRASVQQTYDQIVNDLNKAIALLPVTPLHVFRASKPAACGLLARVYLFMRKYDSCFHYANMGLQLKSDLLDYNQVSQNADFPFADFTFSNNPEIIFGSYTAVRQLLGSRAKIDTVLYQSYNDNDLRKWCYFKDNGDGSHSYKGSYSGQVSLWNGIATDELYLMRAECYARMGKTDLAMQDLNTLMVNRWKQGTFKPFKATTSDEALEILLQERRKELVMRNIRWMDIKRLNKEGAGIILKRIVDGHTYSLPPNDPRSALAVPEDIVNLFGIKQNPR